MLGASLWFGVFSSTIGLADKMEPLVTQVVQTDRRSSGKPPALLEAAAGTVLAPEAAAGDAEEDEESSSAHTKPAGGGPVTIETVERTVATDATPRAFGRLYAEVSASAERAMEV